MIPTTTQFSAEHTVGIIDFLYVERFFSPGWPLDLELAEKRLLRSTTSTASVKSALSADPRGFFPSHYAAMRPRFLAELPVGFCTISESSLKLAFSSVMAFLLKPYGPTNPLTLSNL